MKLLSLLGLSTIVFTTIANGAPVKALLSQTDKILTGDLVLSNDSFVDSGSEVYLQMGFVTGEKAGVWVKVPETVPYFKAKFFRVLVGSGEHGLTESNASTLADNTIYFQAGVAAQPNPTIPKDVSNAAQVTPGPYWNDIPLQGSSSKEICAKGGQYIGAAVEFTHDGIPSVYRDGDGLSNAALNVIMAIPGGWNYSASYGLTGDWVLRVVGEPTTEAECKTLQTL